MRYEILSFYDAGTKKTASFLVSSDSNVNIFSSELHEFFSGSDVTMTLTEVSKGSAIAVAYNQPDCPDSKVKGTESLQSAFQGQFVGWDYRDDNCETRCPLFTRPSSIKLFSGELSGAESKTEAERKANGIIGEDFECINLDNPDKFYYVG